jgi:hypothetical protein
LPRAPAVSVRAEVARSASATGRAVTSRAVITLSSDYQLYPAGPSRGGGKNNSHGTETNVAAPPSLCGPVYVTKFRHSYFRSVNGGPFGLYGLVVKSETTNLYNTRKSDFVAGLYSAAWGKGATCYDPGPQRRLDNLSPAPVLWAFSLSWRRPCPATPAVVPGTILSCVA